MLNHALRVERILAPIVAAGVLAGAGCATNPALNRFDAVQRAPARTISVAPTLIEPNVPANQRGQPWYADSITNSAAMQANFGAKITLNDLQTLRGNPAGMGVLEVSAMAKITDIGLIAHLAAEQVGNDPSLSASLRPLERAGHDLAKAARLNPSDAKWIADQLQARRIELNDLGGRAARGDQAAMQQLSQLAAQLARLQLAETLRSTLRLLVVAQHEMRLRESSGAEATDAFYILRRLSFDDALHYVSDADVARRLPGMVLRGQLGGPGIDPRTAANPKIGCFAIDRQAWDPIEVYQYEASCVPSSKAASDSQPWQEKACMSPASIQQMNALNARATPTPTVQAAMRDAYRQYEITYPIPLKVASSRAYQWNDREQWALCEVVIEADTSRAADHLAPPMRPFAFRFIERFTQAQFRSEISNNGERTLRLVQLLTVVPGSSTGVVSSAEQSAGQQPPAAPSASQRKGGAQAAPAANAAIDAKFIIWSRSWIYDRYVAGSAKADSIECNAAACKATGRFAFIRGQLANQAAFQALLESVSENTFVVRRLCYVDPTTSMTDCTQ